VNPGEAPAVLIFLPLEAAPKVLINCLNEGEEDRLADWIAAHDGIAELIARAIELAEEAPAA
jgi:hypothetical protein